MYETVYKLQDGADEFALEPITTLVANESTRKTRRRRKLIVDEVKVVASELMKRHLLHTDDITRAMELAPPTKRLMQWKERSCVERLLELPGCHLASKSLIDVGIWHIISVFAY
jgi:cohesin complex subunit SCC1